MKSSFDKCAVLLTAVTTAAAAHVIPFPFTMSGGGMVPPNGSAASGNGVLAFDHHTFNYTLDLVITGVGLDDLLDAGPNGSPLHIYHASRWETGEIVVDPGHFGDFVQDGENIRLTIATRRFGDNQGAFSSNIFTNTDALYSGQLYVQLFTQQYPDGELRGRIPPIYKGSAPDGLAGAPGLGAPPTQIPAPGTLAVWGAVGMVARRRRRGVPGRH